MLKWLLPLLFQTNEKCHLSLVKRQNCPGWFSYHSNPFFYFPFIPTIEVDLVHKTERDCNYFFCLFSLPTLAISIRPPLNWVFLVWCSSWRRKESWISICPTEYRWWRIEERRFNSRHCFRSIFRRLRSPLRTSEVRKLIISLFSSYWYN